MLQTDVYLGLRVDELITGGLLAGGGGVLIRTVYGMWHSLSANIISAIASRSITVN